MENNTVTRCKFRCCSVKKTQDWTGQHSFSYEATFTAVVDGSEENKQFFKFTPSGQLSVSSCREDVFEVGKAYYIDLILASPSTESKL